MRLNLMKYLLDAYEKRYAVPAFDYSDIYDAVAVIQAAEEANSPVILMTISFFDRTVPVEVHAGLLKAMTLRAKVPVFLHIDHSNEYGICERAVISGYDSVMIDASKYDLDENIRQTLAVTEFAHRNGAYVEAEIGHIKGRNIEAAHKEGEDFLVKTSEAAELVKRTGVDFLAVGVGSQHGFYVEEPNINQGRLSEVNKALGIPLVMHGGTGIPKEMMRESIRNGISKVNVGTDILTNYGKQLYKKLKENDGLAAIMPGIPPAMEAVKETALRWIDTCMSGGKAEL
jgi:ketose-bisphosphate aldolase